jgi:O-antigen/teichoic acid export membrane protein
MIEARGIARNATVLGAARILERGSGLVLALLISRQIGVAGLGVYATATAYFSLIAIAASAGSTSLLIREIAKAPERTSDYVVHASIIAGALSGLVALVAWIVVPHAGYSHQLETSLLLIVLAVVPGTLNTIQEAAFVAHQRVELETITTFVSTIVLLGTSAYLLTHGHGVISVLVTFVIVEYGVTICYFVLINRFIVRLRLRFRRSFALQLIRDIRAFAAMSLLAAIFARPEVIMLSLITSEVNVGLYVAALKIVDLWSFIPEVYMTNVFPVLSRSFHVRDGRAQRIQDVALTHLAAVAIPLSVGICVAAGPIIEFFYGPGFEGSVLLLRILAVTVTAVSVWAVLWRVLAAGGRQSSVLRSQIITIGLRVGLGYILILWLDQRGAALATAGSLVIFTMLLAAEIHHEGMRVRILPLTWRFALASAAMGLAVAVSVGIHLPLWAFVPAAAAVYLACLLGLGAFSISDMSQTTGLLARTSKIGR